MAEIWLIDGWEDTHCGIRDYTDGDGGQTDTNSLLSTA